uniref:Uncharacterized protein n=1 Tax=Ailuropoda melanoleuca TaxID=9646 RepID=A0A7N5JQJ2_AILME
NCQEHGSLHNTDLLSYNSGCQKRLKRGKEGAPTEIEQYCLQREKEFKAKEAVLRCGDRDAGEDDHPQTYFQPNSDEILGTVSAFVCDIRPEIHEHHRINREGKKEQLCVWIGILFIF